VIDVTMHPVTNPHDVRRHQMHRVNYSPVLVPLLLFFCGCGQQDLMGVTVDQGQDSWSPLSATPVLAGEELAPPRPCDGIHTFCDRDDFLAAVGFLTTIDFEGIATNGGQAGAVSLAGDELAGVLLTPGPDAQGLFVGIPDPSIPGGNNANFFAYDFFPTSGVAVLALDLHPALAPNGTLIVDFDNTTTGVGAYLLDVENAESSIEAFDAVGGTGNSLGRLELRGAGDNSQAFVGIAAAGVRSAVLVLGGGNDGVGLDDLCFVPSVR